MSIRSQVTAAPIELTIKDEVYLLRPLQDSDYGELEVWLQDQYINVTKRNLKGLDKEQQATLLERAFDTAVTLTLTSPEASPFTLSPGFSVRMVWMALRRDRPNMTMSDVADLLVEPETLDAAMFKLELIEKKTLPKKARLRRTRPKVRRRK